MQGSFCSPAWAQVLQLCLPHSLPFQRFLLEKTDSRLVPPFSATLTLNPSMGWILSKVSLIFFCRSPPLVNSTKRTVVILCWFPCSATLLVLVAALCTLLLWVSPALAGSGCACCSSASSLPSCLNHWVLTRSFLVLLCPELWAALLWRGIPLAWHLATFLSYPLIPLTKILLIVATLCPLFSIFWQKISRASILILWLTVSLKASSLLMTSLLKDLIMQFWFRAVSVCRHWLEAIGFSKKAYSITLLLFTLSLKSRVGNQPSWKSSSVSTVNAKHFTIPCIDPKTALLVLSIGESSWSSCSHSLENQSSSCSHLQPGLRGYRKFLASSTNLPSSSTWMLLSATLFFHLMSHLAITTRARAQVDRSPMGPPSFCL